MPASKDAIALLKADHRKVEELFDQYEKARGRKAGIVNQICMELTIHTIIEEEIFYPACRDAGVEDDAMDEANVEHDGAKVLIAELENGTPGDEFFDAKVTVLSEDIKHHVKEEEKRDGIFAQARAAGIDLEALGEQLMARKEELKAEFKANGLPAPEMVTLTAATSRRRAA
jgi:hypothetical protein